MVESHSECRSLSMHQVSAANRLYRDHMPKWRRSDEALHALANAFPGNSDPAHVLCKAAALNTLYGTNVFDVVSVAEHVSDVLEAGHSSSAPELVEAVAWVPSLKRRFLSFASKYCHFFADSTRFAIYDSAALEALRFHLGEQERGLRTEPVDYGTWLTAIQDLREKGRIDCCPAELDHYLWLCGQWIRKHAGRPVNKEADALFDNPAAQPDLREAFGALGLATA